jgi:hypothetical protein
MLASPDGFADYGVQSYPAQTMGLQVEITHRAKILACHWVL